MSSNTTKRKPDLDDFYKELGGLVTPPTKTQKTETGMFHMHNELLINVQMIRK